MDSWQLQCCGEPFGIGGSVSWTLIYGQDLAWLTDLLAPTVVRVDAAEDHHGGGIVPVSGTVTRIRRLDCRFDPSPVPGSGQLSEVGEAVKWVEDRGDLRFAGLVVQLQEDRQA
jgi:hypothetical protein